MHYVSVHMWGMVNESLYDAASMVIMLPTLLHTVLTVELDALLGALISPVERGMIGYHSEREGVLAPTSFAPQSSYTAPHTACAQDPSFCQ